MAVDGPCKLEKTSGRNRNSRRLKEVLEISILNLYGKPMLAYIMTIIVKTITISYM